MERKSSWIEQNITLDKLTIDEAKELYKKSISSSDEQLKKLYLDKTILGTLYVVYNYIERNNLKLFEHSQYDIDDIQSAFVEIWMEKIRNGELLKVDKYSLIFSKAFINEVYNNLGGSDIVISEQFKITSEHLVDLFYAYIKLKNAGKEFNFYDLMNEFNNNRKYYFHRISYYPEDSVLLLLLENMYNNLNFDKTDDLDISKNKIEDYIKILVNNSVYSSLSNDMAIDDPSDKLLDDIFFDSFIDDVDDTLRDDRKREVIHQRFGLNGDRPKTYEEVGNVFGVTRERIRQMEARALAELRTTSKIKKYIK